MLAKHKGKVAAGLGIFLLSMIAVAYATNTESIHFYVVKDCGTSESTANTWCEKGTKKLCKDTAAGDLDVYTDTKLKKTGWTTNWGNPPTHGFDKDIDDLPEENDLFDYMVTSSVSYVVVSTADVAGGTLGAYWNSKIYIAGEDPNQDNVTLVHEIGHKADCNDVVPNVTLRIMNGIANGSGTEDRVVPEERDNYQSL